MPEFFKVTAGGALSRRAGDRPAYDAPAPPRTRRTRATSRQPQESSTTTARTTPRRGATRLTRLSGIRMLQVMRATRCTTSARLRTSRASTLRTKTWCCARGLRACARRTRAESPGLSESALTVRIGRAVSPRGGLALKFIPPASWAPSGRSRCATKRGCQVRGGNRVAEEGAGCRCSRAAAPLALLLTRRYPHLPATQAITSQVSVWLGQLQQRCHFCSGLAAAAFLSAPQLTHRASTPRRRLQRCVWVPQLHGAA